MAFNYLRSLGLSVGKKVCFLVPEFVKAILQPLVYFVTACVNTLFCGDRRGGGSSAIYYWLLFQYISVDTSSFFFIFSIDLTKGSKLTWL